VTGILELKPGETVTVTLGGVGRPVIGQLEFPVELETPLDWRFAHIICMPTLEEYDRSDFEKLRVMIPRKILDEDDLEKQQALSQAWRETEEGKRYFAASEEIQKVWNAIGERNRVKREQRRVCAVAKDGTFQLDDIFEGDWTFTVRLDAAPPPGEFCGPDNQIGTLERKFFVTAVPGGVSDEPLDLGTLEVRYAPTKTMPKVGEIAPDFELAKIDPIAEDVTYEDTGEKLRLSDYKVKYVILDFWAMWCGPCLAKLPELKTLYETIKDDDRFVMIGISLDDIGSEERLGKFIARREMPWLHGISGNWQSDTVRLYGVNAIPALLLIAPDGTVLLANPDLKELTEKIEELRL
jgi:peroxiredoxin